MFREVWNALGSSHIVYDTDYVLLAYGGLKGALALLLVHEFTESVQHDPYARRVGEKVVLYASSAVFVCLVIQVVTAETEAPSSNLNTTMALSITVCKTLLGVKNQFLCDFQVQYLLR